MSTVIDLRDERALAAFDANYLASYSGLMGSSRFGEYAERRDVALISCGAPYVRSNVAHLKRPFTDLEPALAHATSFFDRLRLPFCFEFRQGSDSERAGIDAALCALGFNRVETPVPGMALSPIPPAPPHPAPLSIERVAGDLAREEFVRTAAIGYGFPEEAGSLIFTRGFLERPEVEAYLGWAEGVAVATSMLFRTGNIAGIYWVATHPDARRRGYGEAITWASIAAGARAGCRMASLQASAMGRPIYSRMGFSHVIDYVRYERPQDGGAPNAV